MWRWLFYLPCLLIAETVGQKVASGEVGNYAVYKAASTLYLLRIADTDDTTVIIEKRTLPRLTGAIPTWDTWKGQKADYYSIDKKTGKLHNALVEEEPLLEFLALELMPTPDAERKRVGAKASAVHFAERALWTPPYTFEGKRKMAPVSVFHTMHGDKRIVFYFVDKGFPYWIEAEGEMALVAIDSGSKL